MKEMRANHIEQLLREAANDGDEQQVALCQACLDLDAEIWHDGDDWIVAFFWHYRPYRVALPQNWSLGADESPVDLVDAIIATLEWEGVLRVLEDGVTEVL
jgi:hypothetical protein